MNGRNTLALSLATIAALASAVLPAHAAEHRLPDGTRIAVRTMQPLSSATLKDNDPVNFAIVEDVVVDSQVVIKQGTPVRGLIVEAEAKRRMGRAGKMMYSVNETRAVDRQVVRLRSVQDRRGDSHVTSTAVTTTAVAVYVPVAAPFFLLRKGSDVVVPEGTRVDVFVDGDHVIKTEPEPSASALSTVPGTGAFTGPGGVMLAANGVTGGAANRPPITIPPPRPTVLTNADILLLHKAGMGPDVIVAKIEASQPAFAVESTDLVALKKAGVPDRVIAAMVAAR